MQVKYSFMSEIHCSFELDFIINLFKKKVFSETGSSSLNKEQATYVYFHSFLTEVESKTF